MKTDDIKELLLRNLPHDDDGNAAFRHASEGLHDRDVGKKAISAWIHAVETGHPDVDLYRKAVEQWGLTLSREPYPGEIDRIA